MGFLEEDAYRKALIQWENEHPLPSSLRQKMQALDAMEQEARQKQERDQPTNTIYNKVTDSVWSMYVAGCPNGGSTKFCILRCFRSATMPPRHRTSCTGCKISSFR